MEEGTLVFGAGGSEERWAQSWPLRGGTYKAVLARNTGAPWPMVAESSPFEVVDFVGDAGADIRALLEQRPELGPKFGKSW